MKSGPGARRRLALAAAVVALSSAVLFVGPGAGAQTPVVRAVLFFSPSCGHCEYVINEWVFPVWFPQYGGEPEVRWDESLGDAASFYLATNGTLEVLFVNVAVLAGAELFAASSEALGIPPQQRGVPQLVVGDRGLVGSGEIPEQFPGIVEAGLAAGGIDWPVIAGLAEALASIPDAPPVTTTTDPGPPSTVDPGSTTTAPDGTTTTGASPSTTAPATTTTSGGGVLPGGGGSPWDRFRRDPLANSFAVVVLVLMVASLPGAVLAARRGGGRGGPGPAVVLLALLGLGVASYLAFVEVGGSDAVCGPVGKCNEVQDSSWAKLFGVIPVGLIGVAGYGVVLLSWGVARFGPARLGDWARVALLAGAAVGVAFSIYLTFLEPFVIGATCMWCLASAVIVTLLLWLAVRPGVAAWCRLRASSAEDRGSARDDGSRRDGVVEVFD